MRLLAALAALATGAALALVIAYWGWQVLGPSAVRVAPAAPANPAATIIAANLFGRDSAQPAPQAAPADAVFSGDTKLLGIIAEPGDRGYALFRSQAGAKLVAQGGEIASGVTLVSVQRDGVTIRDGAGERRYLLRASTPSAARGAVASTTNASARPPAASARAGGTCAPPAGFRGTVVRLNAELLAGVGADTVQWPALLSASGGVIGVMIAWIVAVLVRSFTPVPMSVPVTAVFVGVTLSAVVGLFFGIYPAQRAAQLDPIEALRAEK